MANLIFWEMHGLFLSISHSTGKCKKTNRMGRTWEIGAHIFSHNMGTFFPSNSHPMICFVEWEMHGFSYQFSMARKNTNKKPSYGENLGNWYSLFSHSMGTFFPSDFHPVVCFITWEMHGFSHQFPLARENATKPILWRNLGN